MEVVVAGDGPRVHRQRGKWVVRQHGYDPATGRRRVRQLGTFDTKRAAQAHLRALTEGRIGLDTTTLAQFLETSWLPSKDGRVEVSSYDQYVWAVRHHIIPLLGAVRLRELSPELVDAWLRELIRTDGAGKRRLGPTSARLVRKVLSMALEEAVQRGRIARNPVTLTQPPRAERERKKLGWTIAEAQTFLRVAADHRLYAAFHLSLVSGLRRGEILGLRWQDVDVERHELQVVQQLAVERGRPVLKALKTQSSERTVTFGAATAAVLVAHRERQQTELDFAGPGSRATSWSSPPRSVRPSIRTTSAGCWTG